MTLRSAVEELTALGSNDDPIVWRGEDMTPQELADRWGYDTLAANFRISYYSVRAGKVRLLKNGTLGGMIRDRQRKSPPFKGEHAVKRRCPHCRRSI